MFISQLKGRYLGVEDSHWRLVALLTVEHRFETHADAASWYKNRGDALPSNCIVSGNHPMTYEKTAGVIPADKYGDPKFPERVIRKWDDIYKLRSREFGTFLVCKPEFVELYNPPILYPDTLVKIFGKVPGTRNPPKISESQFNRLWDIALTSGN